MSNVQDLHLKQGPNGNMINGGVAHLGERLICIQKVAGSSPVTSTNSKFDNGY